MIEFSKSEYPLIREATFRSLIVLLSTTDMQTQTQTEKTVFYEIFKQVDYLVPLILISLEDESHFVKRSASNFLCKILESGKEGENFVLNENSINGLFLINFFFNFFILIFFLF